MTAPAQHLPDDPRTPRANVRVPLLLLPLALAACVAGGDSPAAGPTVSYGPEVPFGDGNLRSYVVHQEGVPIEVGVSMSEATLANLPPQHGPGSMPMPDGNSMYAYVLPMPAENPSPIQNVMFDWNPGGHEPPGVYDVPHFDAHFYFVPEAERHAIDPTSPTFAEFSGNYPAPELLPPGYVQPFPEPAAVPMMGVHWVNESSPELTGQAPFTATFIYGTWNGELIFKEPMFTLALLESKPDFHAAFPVPARYAEPGHYPSAYMIRWDEAAREYRIALHDFRPAE